MHYAIGSVDIEVVAPQVLHPCAVQGMVDTAGYQSYSQLNTCIEGANGNGGMYTWSALRFWVGK